MADTERLAARIEAQLRAARFVASHFTSQTNEPYQRASFVVDPVCGMRINKIDAFDMDYEGQSYYFCAVPCREKLTREPDRYRQRRPESGGCGSAPCMTFEAAKKGLERDAEKLHSLEESIDALKRRVSHGPVE